MSDPNRPSSFKRFQAWYSRLAHTWLNYTVLFVVLNIVIGYGYTVARKFEVPQVVAKANPQGMPRQTPLRNPWQMENIDMDAFDGVAADDVDKVLDDMTTMSGFSYQPWTQYALSEYKGKMVTVDGTTFGPEFPVRGSVLDPSVKPDPARPVVDVYLFGGSTCFGWDTADAWTVGSYLWTALQKRNPDVQVRLYNLATPMYYSSQEVLLFHRLAKAGHRPKVAIFLNGLNDTWQMAGEVDQQGEVQLRDQPFMTSKLRDLWHEDQHGRKSGLREYQWVPMVRLAYDLRARLKKKPQTKPTEFNVEASSKFILDTYKRNVEWARSMGQTYGVQVQFFWQPAPFYKYDRSLHRKPITLAADRDAIYARVYGEMEKNPPQGVVYLGDIIPRFGAKRKVFVDDCHYNPSFSRFLAEQMAEHIELPR